MGIATGDSFVGSLESGGQKVWSVLGYVVNLSARLEALTRTLPAAMVNDETTQARLGYSTDFDCHPSVNIKGSRTPITLYSLPLAAAGDEVTLAARLRVEPVHAQERAVVSQGQPHAGPLAETVQPVERRREDPQPAAPDLVQGQRAADDVALGDAW